MSYTTINDYFLLPASVPGNSKTLKIQNNGYVKINTKKMSIPDN